MSALSYEDAFEVASLLRSLADDLETRAVEFDKWQGEKSGYTAASQAWAKDVQQKWRNNPRFPNDFTAAHWSVGHG